MKLVKLFIDFFLDKDNNGDEKRFWGNVSMVAALYYAFTPKPDVAILSILFSSAVALLGGAALADRIRSNRPSNITDE